MTLPIFNLPETPHNVEQKTQLFKMKAYMYDNLPVSLPNQPASSLCGSVC